MVLSADFWRRLALLALGNVCLGSDCGGGTRSYSVTVVADGTEGGEGTWVEATVEDGPGWSGGPQYRERVRVAVQDCEASLISRTEIAMGTDPEPAAPPLTVSATAILGPEIDVPKCPDFESPPVFDPYPSLSCGSPGGERWLVIAPTCTAEPLTNSATWLDAAGTRLRDDLELAEWDIGPMELAGLSCEVGAEGLGLVRGPRSVLELDPANGARVVDSEGAVYDAAAGATRWVWVRQRADRTGCAELEVRAWGGDATATFELECSEPPWDPAAGLVAARPGGFTVVSPLFRYHVSRSNVLDVDAEGVEQCRGRIDWERFAPPR